MSKNVAKVSKKVPEEPQKDSVFDFLYCDTRRIGSYLAQFDESGALEKVVRRESVSKARQRGVKFSLGGGASVLGTGGQGTIGIERGPGDSASEGLERYYDPLWSNAREFLDFLESGNLLERSLAEANIGQFVLISGSVCIFDNSMLKDAWSIPAIKEQLQRGMMPADAAQLPNAKARSAARAEVKKNFDSAFDLLKLMPHVIQCGLKIDEDTRTWSALNREFLVTSAADLLLKEAGVLSGTWNMVGILDCGPYFGNVSTDLSVLGAFGAFAAVLAPNVREMLGRPDGSHGITPLVIFREVSA